MREIIPALVLGYHQDKKGKLVYQTKRRCQTAVELFRRGLITDLYVTTCWQKGGILMGQAMASWFVDQGIPQNRVNFYPVGTNSMTEISEFLFRTEGLDKLFVVSSWYHIPRLYFIFRCRGVRPNLAVAWSASWRDLILEPIKIILAIWREWRRTKVLEQ